MSTHRCVRPSAAAIALAACLQFAGCRDPLPTPADPSTLPALEAEDSGAGLLIAALDDVVRLCELTDSLHAALLTGGRVIMKPTGATAESVYVYGTVTPEGYGAVVTERHSYPHGIPLITVRMTRGGPGRVMVSDLKRYVSPDALLNQRPEYTALTEVRGLSRDTILTRVTRGTSVVTYTFRLPVTTRTSSADGTIRVATRTGLEGDVIMRVTDGDGQLIRTTRSFGETDGTLTTRTDYPDGSWRLVRVRGQADGTVYREVSTGS